MKRTTALANARERVLLIDIGNTRVKWATLKGDRLGRQSALAHVGLRADEVARQVFRRVSRSPLTQLSRVLIVSVAGSRMDAAFAKEARRVLGVSPQYVKSARTLAGVTTRYVEPWRLGADRLVGVIGAWHYAKRRPVMVISVGTAMTVDLVDTEGRHLGGAIVPSPALMMRSLLSQTNGILKRARGGAGGAGLFARSTKGAITQGARHAAVAMAERAVALAIERLGRRPLVLLTGGSAPAIRDIVSVEHEHVPDLVLRGLAVIARDGGTR